MRFSAHATARMRQRGVPVEVARLVMEQWDHRAHVGGGLESRWIGPARLRRLRFRGIPPALLERARGVVLVVEPASGTVVSVLNAARGCHWRYRRGIRGPWRP